AIRVLGLVLIDKGVAFVVVALADQPAEDACGISRVSDTALGRPAVQGGDIVSTDGAPMGLARLKVGPALDAGEQPLDARAIAADQILNAVDRARDVVAHP